MAVAFADQVSAVDRADHAVSVELRGIGAEPHGPAEVSSGRSLLQPFLAHPFGDHADDWLGRLTELGGRCFADPRLVPRRLDAGHLHAEAYSEERNFAFPRELDRGDLPLAAAL